MKNISKAILITILFISHDAVAADLKKGKESFDVRCTSCHGATGLGDGIVAQSLPPGTVANLTKGPFKFAKDLPKVKELIQKGGAALNLNPLMPPAPGISDDELTNLAEYVVSLRGK